MSEEKKTIAFSFSKTKPKISSVVASTNAAKTGAFIPAAATRRDDDGSKVELITSIEGKKLSRADGTTTDRPKAIVIPVEPNRQIVGVPSAKKTANTNDEKVIDAISKNGTNADDLEAVRALMKDSSKRKEAVENGNVKVDLGSTKTDVIGKDLEKVEAADYEAVGIEQFGKACLLGMGWSEKEGIGITNKRKIGIVEPELRPKGLGLGAGYKKSSSKHKGDNDDTTENSLRYVKGAFVEITDGKNKREIGEILGFDDANSRIYIRTPDSDKPVNVLQNCTQLLTKSEYQNILSKRKR